ncbi:MAG: response regulator [Cyanobacteria bacterium CRU_2_1]|nr:response regulator [Cyanobacteria bacterium RU_5_0]NJR60553.1 response regulator [Cyanobacteria bacterium CRU_2_1]
MSHELRTPLNAILGFAQLLLRDPSLNAEHSHKLEIVNRSGEHLLALINDVLEMSKIEAGRITLNEQTVDLPNLLTSLEEMLRFRAESKGLQLFFEREPDVPQYVRIDEGKLRQVLINLLGNAIKFTQTGEVSLRVSKSQPDPIATHPTKPESIKLRFEVEDTGPGIPPSDLETIFDAFVQSQSVHRSKGGTGLGLAISRQFVRLMGGDIQVRSVLQQGAIFTFQIQATLVDELNGSEGSSSLKVVALAPNQPSYRILIVDDQPDNRRLMYELLTQVGFEVREACNGQEAIAIHEIWHPHLIWMDMRMPVMDGYEATRQIRAMSNTHSPVIIALTASVFEEKREAVLAAGCNDFVRKPFRETVIFEKIADYLNVDYLHEEIKPFNLSTQAAINPQTNLASTAIQVMPIAWITALHQAAIQVDSDVLVQLIQEIPEVHRELTQSLTTMVEQFDYDKIIALTERSL